MYLLCRRSGEEGLALLLAVVLRLHGHRSAGVDESRDALAVLLPAGEPGESIRSDGGGGDGTAVEFARTQLAVAQVYHPVPWVSACGTRK
jgi:hypothetical protein